MTPTTLKFNVVSNYDCMLTISVVGVILQVNLTKVLLLDQLNMSKDKRKIITMDNNETYFL